MIGYENQNGRKIGARRGWDIDVRLDGRRVGVIRSLATGFQYKPATGPAGAIFPTLDACKQSLEEDNEMAADVAAYDEAMAQLAKE